MRRFMQLACLMLENLGSTRAAIPRQYENTPRGPAVMVITPIMIVQSSSGKRLEARENYSQNKRRMKSR